MRAANPAHAELTSVLLLLLPSANSVPPQREALHTTSPKVTCSACHCAGQDGPCCSMWGSMWLPQVPVLCPPWQVTQTLPSLLLQAESDTKLTLPALGLSLSEVPGVQDWGEKPPYKAGLDWQLPFLFLCSGQFVINLIGSSPHTTLRSALGSCLTHDSVRCFLEMSPTHLSPSPDRLLTSVKTSAPACLLQGPCLPPQSTSPEFHPAPFKSLLRQAGSETQR